LIKFFQVKFFSRKKNCCLEVTTLGLGPNQPAFKRKRDPFPEVGSTDIEANNKS